MPFHQGVFQCVTNDETPAPEVDSNYEEYFPTAELMTCYGQRSLYPIAENTCAFTRYLDQQPHPHNPIKWEVPPEPKEMDIKILEDLPYLIDVPEELLSDFDSWAHSMLEYQW